MNAWRGTRTGRLARSPLPLPDLILAALLFLQQTVDMLISKQSATSLFLTYAWAAAGSLSGLPPASVAKVAASESESTDRKNSAAPAPFSSSLRFFSFTIKEAIVSGAPCLTTDAFYRGNISES